MRSVGLFVVEETWVEEALKIWTLLQKEEVFERQSSHIHDEIQAVKAAPERTTIDLSLTKLNEGMYIYINSVLLIHLIPIYELIFNLEDIFRWRYFKKLNEKKIYWSIIFFFPMLLLTQTLFTFSYTFKISFSNLF